MDGGDLEARFKSRPLDERRGSKGLDLNLGPWMKGEDLRVEDFLDYYPVGKSVKLGPR